MRTFCHVIALLLLLPLTPSASAGEAYYLVMFGSQRTPFNPNYTHTFATFVKVCWLGDGPCPTDATLEAHTISWLPVNMRVRVNALFPEPGQNFDLPTTLTWARATEQRTSVWGPYPITPELFAGGLARKAELESGRVRYKANDFGYRSDDASNCIHAVSSVVEGSKLRVASPGWGQSASFFVLQKMRRDILSREPVAWVGSALGLDEHPLIYRDWRNPQSNAYVAPIRRVLGIDRNLLETYGPPR